MSKLLERLTPTQRRGSKPRCHWITHGAKADVAARLTALIAPFGKVAAGDQWMPEGFEHVEEAELHKATTLLGPAEREEIKRWWFAVSRGTQTAPSFDIAGTCTVNRSTRKGIFLVEAKAHAEELEKSTAGKPLGDNHSAGQRKNHENIGKIMIESNKMLEVQTGSSWLLSHEKCYQLSNRFASAYKLTAMGIPVILVYLGFIRAMDMAKGGTPFHSSTEWKNVVHEHSKRVMSPQFWDKPMKLNGQPFIPCIRAVTIDHDRPIKEFQPTSCDQRAESGNLNF